MALHFAFVKAAVESASTRLPARVALLCTVDDVRVTPTKALCQLLLPARLARPWMAIALAFVCTTVQYFLAFLAALEGTRVLAASKSSLGFTALAGRN